MKVFVTRHGQTDWNLLKKIQGQTDIELNEEGRKQAKELGELIKNEKIDLIITSPLKRAKETAIIINNVFNTLVIEDSRLMERNFGECEGLNKSDRKELKEKNSEINDIWNYNKNVSYRNIETMKEFCNRVYEFLNDMVKNYRDKNILIVTHGGITVPIKCFFTKYPLEKLMDRDIINSLKNCEIVKYEL